MVSVVGAIGQRGHPTYFRRRRRSRCLPLFQFRSAPRGDANQRCKGVLGYVLFGRPLGGRLDDHLFDRLVVLVSTPTHGGRPYM